MTENDALEYLYNFQRWNEDDRWLDENTMAEFVECVEKTIKRVKHYREIGTVEECREAMKKQKPERPDYERGGENDKKQP